MYPPTICTAPDLIFSNSVWRAFPFTLPANQPTSIPKVLTNGGNYLHAVPLKSLLAPLKPLVCHYQSPNKAAKAATNVFPEPHPLEQGASLDNFSLNPVQYPPLLYFEHLLVEKAKMQENVASNLFDNAMATLKLLSNQPHFLHSKIMRKKLFKDKSLLCWMLSFLQNI